MSDGSRQHRRGDGRSAHELLADLQARGVSTCEADFIASIDAGVADAGVADADADDVMDTDTLERWLAARRRVATPEEPR